MILRAFDPSAEDVARLAEFACSTGPAYEDDVEDWIRTRSLGWLNDVPKAIFQRRQLMLVEDGADLVAVSAWQDIVQVDLDGIWLEVLAVASTSQHGGRGQQAYDLVLEHLRGVDRDGSVLAGLVHVDNQRSQRLLTRNDWQSVAPWHDHELWVGRL